MEINKSAPLDFYNRVQMDKIEQIKPDNPAKAQVAQAPQTDKVSLSEEAQLLTEAYRTAMNTSEIRLDKVADIKARLAEGSYEIDSLRIAQSIVRDELLF